MTVHKRTILIAGGDAEGQARLAAPVAAAGYAVAVANGADALTLVSRTDGDAVVVDVTRLTPEAAVALVRAMRAVTARPLLVLVARHDGETEKVRKMAASPALASATGNSKPIRKVAVQVRTRSVVSNARAHDVDLHLLAAFFLQGRAHGFDLLATRANNGARCSGVNRERHEISLIAPDINLSDGGVGIAPLNKRP
jgi:hypothetical protein